MSKFAFLILSFFSLLAYLYIFQLPYSVWELPLTQNWLFSNGLVLYRDVVYPHPPLPLYSIFALSKVIGNSPEMLRFLSFFLAAIFGYGIFLVGRKISIKIGITLIIFFAITFFPLLSDFNLEEMFVALFTIYSTLFFLEFLQKQQFRHLFISGVLVGLALLSKQVVIGIVFSCMIVTIVFLLGEKNRRYVNRNFIFKLASYFIVGIIFPAVPFFVYFYFNNALYDFLYWNILFNLTIYPSQSTPYALKEGLTLGAWLFLSIIPGIILLFNKHVERKVFYSTVLMVGSTILLVPVLLPSFLIYKIIALYPYALILWAIVWNCRKEKFMLPLLVLGLIVFLFTVGKPFYLDYLPNNIFQSHFAYDYSEDDLKVVNWLKKNTRPNQKIMNLGNHFIFNLSNRLPQNKYVYILPWLVMPFGKSTNEIVSNPPGIIILNSQMTRDDPIYREWKFLSYVENKYEIVQKFGDYEIRVLYNSMNYE